MRRVLKFISAMATLILLVGCGAKQENVVRINLGSEPHTLDPRRARDLQSSTVVKMFFEGLTRINPQDRAEPALAEKIEISPDGKLYTFTLRSASWSNGDPVTAQDFVYAWRKVLEPHFPADQAFQLYVIKNGKAAKEGKVSSDKIGIKALDERTLQVQLEYPVPYFLDLASLPVFFPVSPKADAADHSCHPWVDTVVGNGPFVLKEWKHNDLLRVVKNPAYWDASHVKLKEIDLIMVAEETELKMYEQGELDWAGSPLSVLPLGALASLKEKGLLQTKPFLATYFFRTNVEAGPFQHPLIRKAFALAVKRLDIVEHVAQGQLPATGLLPPSLHAQQQPYFADGDAEQARQYFKDGLAALEISQEALEPVSLLYITSERNHLVAQAVQEQWRQALGVAVQLQAVERKVFYDRMSKKNFQMAIGSWMADFNDAMNFLEVFKFKAGGSNNTAWENSRYRELLETALLVNEPGQREKIFKECESILMTEMPIIPIFHYTMLYLANPQIKDVVLSSLGSLDFKWAYIEKGKNEEHL